ncbi:MAG: site-specific integrase [Clostridia bacterium]|nr:site-specific integrase [Clostridia bacterium]
MKTRNAKGNGSVRQRENGTWEGRCTINGQRKSFYGERQADVLKAMRAAQKASDDGVYFEPAKMTLSKWLDVWLEEYVAPASKPLTYTTYKSRVETHIKPALGRIKLTSLNATQIQALYNNLLKVQELQPKTIKNLHGILHKALEQALKLRYIGLNPADACTLPRIEKKEIKPLSETEIAAFLVAIGEGEPLQDLFTVALFTGMREGEICGLPWNAVDFRAGTITVKQQLCKEKQKGGQHYIAPTKNDKARTLTAAPFVMDILKRVRQEQKNNHLTMGLGWQNEFDLVFTDKAGRYIVPQTALKRFKAIATKIGRPDARFHDLRHTYAVTALQEGDDVKTVQQNLGHATASFTLDVYGHVSEKMKKESAARMQSYFEKIKA